VEKIANSQCDFCILALRNSNAWVAYMMSRPSCVPTAPEHESLLLVVLSKLHNVMLWVIKAFDVILRGREGGREGGKL
jgi:hypothetical protein